MSLAKLGIYKDAILTTLILLGGFLLIHIGYSIYWRVNYANPVYTVGYVINASGGDVESIYYQYKDKDVLHVNSTINEQYNGNTESIIFNSKVGKKFLVQYNAKHPDYAIMYTQVELSDSLEVPTQGWSAPPVVCNECGKRRRVPFPF